MNTTINTLMSTTDTAETIVCLLACLGGWIIGCIIIYAIVYVGSGGKGK